MKSAGAEKIKIALTLYCFYENRAQFKAKSGQDMLNLLYALFARSVVLAFGPGAAALCPAGSICLHHYEVGSVRFC
ncbi:MAG: hypothetical protein DU429_05850 [Candidatus Tokpelaia sp.]|nr:MAG: hypothetical protein DU430_07400 [Candidatus Tokpelaia sp.]KAA6206740.1 MAG: hypothetical protein DU429_05850 [Candidatus Tokpelaia sp.]